MRNFANIFDEVGKLLEETKAVLTEMANEKNAEEEKKGVSWDELSNWIAESENVGEFEMDTDAGDLTYVKKDDDGLCDCEYCTSSCDCEYCTEPEEFNYEDDDFNYDEYDEYRDQMEAEDEYDDCNKQEAEPTPKGLSLLEYKEIFFSNIEKWGNDDSPRSRVASDNVSFTDVISEMVWELMDHPKEASPERITEAQEVIGKSNYLYAVALSRVSQTIKTQAVFGLWVNFDDMDEEIKNYLKEKN